MDLVLSAASNVHILQCSGHNELILEYIVVQIIRSLNLYGITIVRDYTLRHLVSSEGVVY